MRASQGTAAAAALLLATCCGASGNPPPAKCQDAMNAFCNAPALHECMEKVESEGGKVPLVALNDTGLGGKLPAEWRCYSPTCLDATKTRYVDDKCRMYCTSPALADVLDNCTHPRPPPVDKVIRVNATNVWGAARAAGCGQIRTPELVVTPSRVLLLGQCRNGNATGGGSGSGGGDERLGDDMRSDRVVLIASTDGGRHWDPATYSVLTPRGRSVPVAVYDAVRKAVVIQFQSFTQSNPYAGNTLWQAYSHDDGETWTTPVNVTSVVAACNSGPGGQVCGAAGSRLQTRQGRIVFSGHNGPGGGVCVWYSDDGGATFKSTAGKGPNGSLLIPGNEQSIADLGNGSLYMNGRGMAFPFKGHRASYWSHDQGATWTFGTEAFDLAEPNTFGCDGAVVSALSDTGAAPPRVFFSEPAGPGSRKTLRVWCSRDAGVSWGRYVEINTGDVAAYSALEVIKSASGGPPSLLVVWEQAPTMLSYQLPIDNWCPYVQ